MNLKKRLNRLEKQTITQECDCQNQQSDADNEPIEGEFCRSLIKQICPKCGRTYDALLILVGVESNIPIPEGMRV